MAMAKPSFKSDYLTGYIIERIERGDYVLLPFPSERALAEETGMSLTTARRAVLNAIERGYLVRNKTSGQPEVHPHYFQNVFEKHVAVILPAFPSQANADWYVAVENVCAGKHCSISMITYHSKDDPVLIKHLNGPYDLIFFFPPPDPPPLVRKQMLKAPEKIITFFHDYTDLGIATLCDPPKNLTVSALNYLMQRNCRTIDCLNAGRRPNRMIDNQIDLWQTFLKTNKLHGLLVDHEHTTAALHHELARSAIATHLKNNRLPDAFICTTGMAAIGAVRGLADCSLRAGLDVKVLALSSNPMLQFSTPSITSMRPPVREELIKQAFTEPRPLRIESAEAELFIGETTELKPR